MIFILIVILFIDETKETVIRPQKQNTFFSNRFTFSEAVFLCQKLKGDVNMKYGKNIAR